jgi:DUF4097 and DUF4098 domain-containing protein YvlB
MAGPVVLIIVGGIFLFGTMGMLSWAVLGRWFARYWPLLIILWGVMKLLEHQRAQRLGTRASGIGAGGVFLLIFLIGGGLMATQASHLNWDEIRDQMDGHTNFPMFGHSYSFDSQVTQDFPAGSSLHVVNDRGAVNLNVSTDGKLHVAAHKRVNAENQQDADKWNAGSNPTIVMSGNTVTMNANTQGAGEHWVTSDLDISLPRKAAAVIAARHGDVSVMGRDGDVDVTSQHGDTSVTDVNGKVSLNLDDSSARVSQVSSDVSIEGKANDVSIEDVKGAVRLDGDFKESLKLVKIAKAVSFKSSRTTMDFARLDGDLDLDSGDLQATNIVGPGQLQTRSKDIRLAGVAGDLRLQNENGAVEIRVSKLGSMQVENRQGDIQIYLPEKAGFQVDARARNGEIQSDYNEVKVESSDDDRATATGKVGNGGPQLTLSNEHGTIEIHRGGALADIPAPPPPPHGPKPPGHPESPEESDN